MTKRLASRTHLPMTPTKVFGRIMAVTNNTIYQSALDALVLPQRGALLEMGFGAGKLIELALAKWPQANFAGVDPTPAMLDLAKSNKSLKKHGDCIDLRLGGAEHLAWDDSTFDCVVAVNSFQFWSPPEAAISEIWRVLNRGGQVVLVLRDHSHFAPDWLPNPISKSGNEVDGALGILEQFGFADLSAHKNAIGHTLIKGTKP